MTCFFLKRSLPGACALAVTLSAGAEPDRHPALEVLERQCISCHDAETQKGGLVLARGPLNAESHRDILRLISGDEPEMPKDREPLSAGEIGLIEDWLKAGAPVPEGQVLVDRYEIDHDWWSLQPLNSPELPPDDPWCRNEIDRFVLARMTEKGLRPSPPAEPTVLLRRLAYDLTGLPPSLEETQHFLKDWQADPERAWNDAVARLLDSPQYGEHWARHWLDVVRYGETHGYDKDKLRPNAWPYRDYVIQSLNEDKPWGRFVQEQIAGDVLWPGEEEGVVALGFIAAGPWDLIAHSEVGEGKVDGRIAKHMDRDDMVSATFNAFMSTTVQCAQCHDHKGDPISMEDYYRLHAIFAAVDRADRVYGVAPEIEREEKSLSAELSALKARKQVLEDRLMKAGGEKLAHLTEEVRLLEERVGNLEKPAEHGYHSRLEPGPDVEKWVRLDLGREVEVTAINLIGAYDDFAGIGAGFGFPVRFRVETADDADFTQNVRLLADHTGSDVANPGVVPFRIGSEGGSAFRHLRVTATRLAERRGDYMLALAEIQVLGPRGNNLASDAKVSALDSIESGPRWSRDNLVDGRYAEAGDPAAMTELAEVRSQHRSLLESLRSAESQAEEAALDERISAVSQKLRALPKGRLVYAAATEFNSFGKVLPTGGKPRPIHLLHRGDIRNPGEEMSPGAPPLWDGASEEFALAPDHSEGDRRAALARYLTDPENPLVWRSIVNRVWLQHMGDALVDTPNDFGRLGEKPTHPGLLDWLADRFRSEGAQSLKELHRLILHSATWRQVSWEDPERAALDGGNAFYWRANRRRLTAEELRDTVLRVAGKLNLEMGGPSFRDFVIEKPQHSPHFEYHLHDPDDPSSHRRAIYRMIVRSQTQPFLTTFDCADPSQMVARRDETTTALQALSLMNNPFMLTMAEHLAGRVKNHPRPVGEAVRLALGREAAEDELALLEEYDRAHGLANTCRVILNLSEFCYVD